ncbi:uncharacterized protein LOC110988503 [Acanthaster planci]|uniref:Uncharacterized protein LOC110988503 n=1 Tax=Acanthaster planci TaxID=133434 RepID=A0A8B7ZW59_ACAPL|nr:uncharacterized protein LOC110988503 [Acanthaster planci]
MAGSDAVYKSSASTEETPLVSSSRPMSQNGYPGKLQPWPRPLVVALCMLGLWRPGALQRASGQGGKCGRRPLPRVYSHQPSSARSVDCIGNTNDMSSAVHSGEGPAEVSGNDEAEQVWLSRGQLSWSQSVGNEECYLDGTQCDICNNYYGAFHTSDGKIKTLLCNGVMLLYLLTLTGLMAYDFAIYIIEFWGRKQNVLFLVSYFTYLFQVLVVPMFGLLTRFMAWAQLLVAECTWAALHNDFVFQRSQFLRAGTGAASFLSLGVFLVWPTFNGVLRIVYGDVYRPVWNTHAFLSRWTALASYVVYGSFCYLVYAQRRSFQNEFRVAAHFVASNAPRGDAGVDVSKDRLSSTYHQYRLVRNFVGTWMAFTMAVATWGLTAHLTWNYIIFTYCNSNQVAGLPVLNLLIWSQKIMFFVLPSLAVGGINMDYMWREFRFIMANHSRRRYSAFWHAIRKHLSSINLLGQGLSATLVFSALGLYLGLELGNSAQNVAFWNGPGEFHMFNISMFCDFKHN